MGCEYCRIENPSHCCQAPDERHELDPETLEVGRDEEGPYLSVTCKHCNRSGHLRGLRDFVAYADWEK